MEKENVKLKWDSIFEHKRLSNKDIISTFNHNIHHA